MDMCDIVMTKPGSQPRRSTKLPKNFNKYRVIARSDKVKGGNRTEMVDPNFRRQDPTETGMTHSDVCYSMNKKSRWNLSHQFNNISQFQAPSVHVSATERASAFQDEHLRPETRRPCTVAYHSVTKNPVAGSGSSPDFVEFHRKSKKSYAFKHDLTKPVEECAVEKKKGKKKRVQVSSRTHHRQIRIERRNGLNNDNANHLADFNEEELNFINDHNNDTETERSLEIDYTCLSQDAGKAKKLSMRMRRPNYQDYFVSHVRKMARMNNIKFNCQDYDNFYSEEFEPVMTDDETDDVVHHDGHDSDNDDDDKREPGVFPINDFVVDKARQNNDKSDNGSTYSFCSDSTNSVDDGSWSLVDLDMIDELTAQKPWVRQISQPGPYLPWKFRKLYLQTREDGPSTSGQPIRVAIPEPKFAMTPVTFKIDNDSLEDEYLKRTFGVWYYEVNCIPRRFCIDVSKGVRNVALLSHGDQSVQNNMHTLLVCQVEMLTLDKCKMMDSMSGDDTQWSNVSVWMNGSFNDCAEVTLPLGSSHDVTGVWSITDVIKMCVMIGSESMDRFCALEQTCKSFSLSRVPVMSELHAILQPQADCIDEQQATSVALMQTGLQPKVQRLRSVIECYPFFVDEPEGQCSVCFNGPVSQIGFCLAACQHWMCSECWSQYCLHEIHNGRVPITCPEVGCDEKVDYDVLSTFIPYPQCVQYANQLRDRHMVDKQDTWVYCPNTKCSRIILLQEEAITTVVHCDCGEIWCKECGSKPHWPLTCQQWKKYLERLTANGDDIEQSVSPEDRLVEVKRCPHCNHPMEKGFGCNHMSCRCGGQFCWSCLSDWNSNSHYNCALESKRHVETLVLRDVNRKAECYMSQACYDKAVYHRHAMNRNKTRHLIMHLKPAAARNQKSLPAGAFGDSLLTNQVVSANIFVKDFVSLVQQAHSLLQFTYVWLDITRHLSHAQKTRVHSLAERTAFCLKATENACECEPMDKIEIWKERTKKSLIKMLNTIVAAQK